LQLHVLHAATEAEIEAAFAGFAQLRAGVIGAALFSMPRAGCLLSFRCAMVPAIYEYNEFAKPAA